MMKSKEPESAREIISVFRRRKGREPNTSSREWLDWCYVWNRCVKNQTAPIKKRIDTGQFDYQDFVTIWKATARERKR